MIAKTFGWVGSLIGGKEESVIAISQERRGDKTNVFEHIAFDLQNLDPGINRLEVDITDLNTQMSDADTVEFDLLK